MSKIILLDTNFSASPIYKHLIKNNNEVFVVGSNPADYLAKTVKNYINLDYSDIDKMTDLLKSLKIDYIVPGGNDMSYQICTLLNKEGEFKGLDSTENNDIINNKEKFRTFALRHDIPVPRIFTPDQVGDVWPLIIKPVDAYSGRGITVLRKHEKSLLKKAIINAKDFSRSKNFIIEEYVEGQLYSHSAFVSNGAVVIDFIVEEHGTANAFVVDTSRVVYDFPQKILKKLRDEICKMSKVLNLADGLIHTQFIKNGDFVWLIEITRRCPGDLYSMLIELSTGFSYAETYSKPFLNEEIAISNRHLDNLNILRLTISQSFESYFGSLQFNIPVTIEKFVPLSITGDLIKASPYGRIGLLFLKAGSRNELGDMICKAQKRELYYLREC